MYVKIVRNSPEWSVRLYETPHVLFRKAEKDSDILVIDMRYPGTAEGIILRYHLSDNVLSYIMNEQGKTVDMLDWSN